MLFLRADKVFPRAPEAPPADLCSHLTPGSALNHVLSHLYLAFFPIRRRLLQVPHLARERQAALYSAPYPVTADRALRQAPELAEQYCQKQRRSRHESARRGVTEQDVTYGRRRHSQYILHIDAVTSIALHNSLHGREEPHQKHHPRYRQQCSARYGAPLPREDLAAQKGIGQRCARRQRMPLGTGWSGKAEAWTPRTYASSVERALFLLPPPPFK